MYKISQERFSAAVQPTSQENIHKSIHSLIHSFIHSFSAVVQPISQKNMHKCIRNVDGIDGFYLLLSIKAVDLTAKFFLEICPLSLRM
jgi:hypothetical protein